MPPKKPEFDEVEYCEFCGAPCRRGDRLVTSDGDVFCDSDCADDYEEETS